MIDGPYSYVIENTLRGYLCVIAYSFDMLIKDSLLFKSDINKVLLAFIYFIGIITTIISMNINSPIVSIVIADLFFYSILFLYLKNVNFFKINYRKLSIPVFLFVKAKYLDFNYRDFLYQ
ncbi:hypothetical protein CL658_02350 [bacterium]|nr:hypothetical protein [bacterium]